MEVELPGARFPVTAFPEVADPAMPSHAQRCTEVTIKEDLDRAIKEELRATDAALEAAFWWLEAKGARTRVLQRVPANLASAARNRYVAFVADGRELVKAFPVLKQGAQLLRPQWRRGTTSGSTLAVGFVVWPQRGQTARAAYDRDRVVPVRWGLQNVRERLLVAAVRAQRRNLPPAQRQHEYAPLLRAAATDAAPGQPYRSRCLWLGPHACRRLGCMAHRPQRSRRRHSRRALLRLVQPRRRRTRRRMANTATASRRTRIGTPLLRVHGQSTSLPLA